MPTKRAPSEAPKTTFMLIMKDGTKRKVTVPEDWKVTFGPLMPGSKDASHNSSAATALRFYTGKDRQKAVFTGVESFRDMSIGMEEEVVKTQAETFYKDTPEGKKQFIVEGNVREWQNPDAPKARPNEMALEGLPHPKDFLFKEIK